MRRRRVTRLLPFALGLVVLGILWFYFAPVGVGGSTTYVVTDGVSMEPHFHGGDLVAVRSRGSYHVGEIVAYHSKVFDTIVLHRIIARAGSRYVFKGDNNNFVDFEHPAKSQLIGSLWLHIPGAGSRLQSLRSPALVGALVAVGTLLLAGAAFTRRSRRRRRARRAGEGAGNSRAQQPQRTVGPVAGVTAIGAASLLPFIALALLAFTRPSAALLPSSIAYRQSATFAYSASASPGPAYPGNRAVTGDPLFTRVLDAARLRFLYTFKSAAGHSLAGRASLAASVASTTGWQRTLQLAGPSAFRGDHTVLTARLDIAALVSLLRRVQSATALSGSYTLTLAPHVDVGGSLGGEPLHAVYAPQLRFSLSNLELQPLSSTGAALAGASASVGPFIQTSSGTVNGKRSQPLYLSLKLFRLPVATARAIALIAIALILCVLAAILVLIRPRRREESAAIQARYGRLIIPVARVWQLPGVSVIDVADIEALVRIAEHYDRSILHEIGPEGEAFWVTDESGQFRYALSEPAPLASEGSIAEAPLELLVSEVYADELALGGVISASETAPTAVALASYLEAPRDEPDSDEDAETMTRESAWTAAWEAAGVRHGSA